MSPTIPILSALLLSLISGSTESGQRMDSVALLRQTLRYWLKIYKTYHEEVMLGYCWAGYLLEISDELSANLSATPLAVTGDRPNTSIGATKSQQNPFPQNVMVHATSHGGARTRKHLRRRRSYATSSTIWKFINSPDEHRDTSRSRIIRQRWTMNMAERGVSLNDRADESEESDGNESTQLIDSYHGKSRHASMSPEIHQDEGEASRGHGFSSRRTSWRAVNPPASNPPKDDDKVDSGLMVSGGGKQEDEKGDTRRKVLRSLTSHRDSPEAEGVLQLPSFSLKVSRGRRRRSLDGRRFPFRRRSPPRERNLRVDEPLSNPCRMPEVNRGMKDPERHRVPLSGDGGVPTPSRLQFRRVSADTDRCRRCRTGAVKLMDSKGNSSRDPTRAINSRTSRRKPEELSRDSLLSPRGGGTAERSTLESSRGGGKVAIKRNAFPRAETTGASGTRKRRPCRSREEGGSWTGRDVPAVMCIFCRSGLARTEKPETFYGEWCESLPVAAIPGESAQRDGQLARTTGKTFLSPLEEFTNDHGDSTSQSVRRLRSNALRNLQTPDRQSPVQQPSFVSILRSIIIGAFRTLGMFVQVGRQVMDAVESNTALVCTKEYLWAKIVKWIDA